MVQSAGNEILYNWAKVFANVYTLIYTVWLCYNAHRTFVTSECGLPMAYAGCITFLVALLIMALSSVILSDGLKGGRADELVPWLFCTLVMEIASIVLLINAIKPQNILLSVIIVLNVITWYPIFGIYRKLSKVNTSADEEAPSEVNRSEICPSRASTRDRLGSTITISSVATEQNSLAMSDDRPPNYDSIRRTPRKHRRKHLKSISNSDTDSVTVNEISGKLTTDSRAVVMPPSSEASEQIHGGP